MFLITMHLCRILLQICSSRWSPEIVVTEMQGISFGYSAKFQFSSVTHSCPTLCNTLDCSTQGFPVHHQHREVAQTHVHLVGDVIPFSSYIQSFPASGSFPMSQFFTFGGQSIGVLASASVLPMNIKEWFPLELTGLNLLAVQGTLKILLQHHSSKASIFWHSAFLILQLSHPYMTTEKP